MDAAVTSQVGSCCCRSLTFGDDQNFTTVDKTLVVDLNFFSFIKMLHYKLPVHAG